MLTHLTHGIGDLVDVIAGIELTLGQDGAEFDHAGVRYPLLALQSALITPHRQMPRLSVRVALRPQLRGHERPVPALRDIPACALVGHASAPQKTASARAGRQPSVSVGRHAMEVLSGTSRVGCRGRELAPPFRRGERAARSTLRTELGNWFIWRPPPVRSEAAHRCARHAPSDQAVGSSCRSSSAPTTMAKYDPRGTARQPGFAPGEAAFQHAIEPGWGSWFLGICHAICSVSSVANSQAPRNRVNC